MEGERLPKAARSPFSFFGGRLGWLPHMGIPAQRIGQVAAGRSAITADTDLRLCGFFGLSNG